MPLRVVYYFTSLVFLGLCSLMRPIISGIAYQSPALYGAVDRESGLINHSSVRDVHPVASFGLTVQSFPITQQLEYPALRQHHLLRFTFHRLRLMVAVGARLGEVAGWVIFRCFGCGGSILLPAGRSGLLRVPAYLVSQESVVDEHPFERGSVSVDVVEQEWVGIGMAHRWCVDMVFEMDFPHRVVGRWTEVPGEIFGSDVIPGQPRMMSHFTFIQEVEVGGALGQAGWWMLYRSITEDLDANNLLDGLERRLGLTDEYTRFGREPSGRVFRIVEDPDIVWNVRLRDQYVVSPLCILESLGM